MKVLTNEVVILKGLLLLWGYAGADTRNQWFIPCVSWQRLGASPVMRTIPRTQKKKSAGAALPYPVYSLASAA